MFLGNFRAVFRNASYPLEDIPEAGNGVPVAWIKLPKDLFNIHCRFFLRSRALVDKLEFVLDNMEHRLYMEEGRIPLEKKNPALYKSIKKAPTHGAFF
mgnify:CR=1 FL=1